MLRRKIHSRRKRAKREGHTKVTQKRRGYIKRAKLD
jgi:hypothetical protein